MSTTTFAETTGNVGHSKMYLQDWKKCTTPVVETISPRPIPVDRCMFADQHPQMDTSAAHIQCESKKIPPMGLDIFSFFSQTVENL